MKSGAKQRIFWCISALLIAAVLFSFCFLDAGQPGGSPDVHGDMEMTPLSLQRGLTVENAIRVSLFILLGFSLNFCFYKNRKGIPLAIGTGILFSAALEVFREIFLQNGCWQDAAMNGAGIAAGVFFAVLVSFLLRFLKKRFEQENSHERPIEAILDTAAIAAVLHYAVFRFLQNTMFIFYFSDRYKTVILLLLILAGGSRFLYLILRRVWQVPEPRDQSFLILRYLFAFCLAIPFFLVSWLHNYKPLFFLPFAALCLYEMKPEKVFRAFLFTIGTVLAATVLCCLSGTVRNLVSIKEGNAAAYGTINSTDFASYFSFLLLTAWCCMKSRSWQASVLFALFTGAVSFSVAMVSCSRTVLTVGSLTVFFILWDCLEAYAGRKTKLIHGIGKGLHWFSVLAFPLLGIFVAVAVAAYGQKIPWAVELDKVLSQRLEITWQPYQTYGIHPFGSTIDTMLGKGGTIVDRLISGYSYLDVAYAMLMIRYGWVITGIVAGLWIWFTARAIKTCRRRIAFAMAVLAIHAFSEAKFLEVNYNIFLVMPFCAMSAGGKKDVQADEESPVKESKFRWFPVLAFLIMMGCVYLALPTALSWLRTFFALKRWNSGTAAFGSLIVCTAIILLLIFFWKAAVMLWTRRGKKYAVLLVSVVLLATAGTLTINGEINSGMEEQADRLAEEEQIIRKVQEAAVLPVYAAEASEMYQRRIGGFTGHSFSTEELARPPRGSLFTDSAVEALTITETGGKYLQFSDWSGLYSYDPAVIEALDSAGWTWQSFYSGRIVCDLKEAARYNGLEKEDTLVLRGPVRFTTQNKMLDQAKGYYAVSFTVSSPLPAEDGKVAVLEVFADVGERMILQEQLTADDFDDQGKCTYAMIYYIPRTPLVYFGISVDEGACVAVEEIFVQRIGQSVELDDGVNHLINPTDSLSAWINPPNYNTKSYQIATLILRDSHPGDIYTCRAEIEFENVTAIEGKAFVFTTFGQVDGSTKIENIWNKKLIQLDTPPDNGLYQYAATSMITEKNANASGFDLAFRCENWASGSFRIISITIEKSRFITVQPADAEVSAGEKATFQVAAAEAAEYQWYYQRPGETTWNKVKNNSTSAVYTLTAKELHNGFKYRCKVTGSLGSVNSDIAVLTVK